MRAPIAALLLAGCATAEPADAVQTAPADPIAALAGRTATERARCLDQSRLLSPDIVDTRTILYRQSNARIWRNDLPRECRSLARNDIIVVQTSNTRLCQGDRFRALSRNGGVPGPVCRLGGFVAYDRADRRDDTRR